jgi:hypothetical protein
VKPQRGLLSAFLVISVRTVLQVLNVNQCHRESADVMWNLTGSLEENESPSGEEAVGQFHTEGQENGTAHRRDQVCLHHFS